MLPVHSTVNNQICDKTDNTPLQWGWHVAFGIWHLAFGIATGLGHLWIVALWHCGFVALWH